MEITILTKSSSSPEPRTVQVIKDDAGLSFYCNCPAGERERICKHKKGVASGDEKILYDEDQIANFSKAMDWVAQSGYLGLMKDLEESENKLASAHEKVKSLKEKIARGMREGLE
jgi:hypothetical protein